MPDPQKSAACYGRIFDPQIFQEMMPPRGSITSARRSSAPDGKRFLLDAVVEQHAPPISLILNWKRPGE